MRLLPILFILLSVLASLSTYADIQYTYDIPTTRADGSALDPAEISHYTLTYQIDGVPQADLNTANGTITSILAPGGAGVWTAQISTTDTGGLTGSPSPILVTEIDPIVIAPPGQQVLTGTWICNSTPCVLEMK